MHTFLRDVKSWGLIRACASPGKNSLSKILTSCGYQRYNPGLPDVCRASGFGSSFNGKARGYYWDSWKWTRTWKKSESLRLMISVLCGKYKPEMTYFAVVKQRWCVTVEQLIILQKLSWFENEGLVLYEIALWQRRNP